MQSAKWRWTGWTSASGTAPVVAHRTLLTLLIESRPAPANCRCTGWTSVVGGTAAVVGARGFAPQRPSCCAPDQFALDSASPGILAVSRRPFCTLHFALFILHSNCSPFGYPAASAPRARPFCTFHFALDLHSNWLSRGLSVQSPAILHFSFCTRFAVHSPLQRPQRPGPAQFALCTRSGPTQALTILRQITSQLVRTSGASDN
jgi:hypothetical protein